MPITTIESLILERCDVGEALRVLRERMSGLTADGLGDQLEQIEEDYRLMCDCFRRGMRDPNGETVYTDLLRRTYKLYNNVRLASIVRRRSAYLQCDSMAVGINTQKEEVKANLENFVQEVAMATLFDGNERSEMMRRAYRTHQNFMEKLFCSLVVARQWNTDTATYYQQMLMSPTIDQNDALAIVSAITLSLITVFDICKWNLLVALYENATVEPMRQRALVGMVLTMPNGVSKIYDEIPKTLQRLCADSNIRHELLETQMQLYYCTQTQADTEHIQRDIMPTLIKNNNLRISRGGIVEKDNSIDDIIDTSATDRKMAELEEKMNKMADMQKAGSDIYFSGFSQMKKFPFFSHLCNWFTPFYLEHPDITAAISNESLELVSKMVGKVPFCDSDKYSFVLGMAMVVGKLPSGIREMICEGRGIADHTGIDHSDPAYIRRMYIQDLYRFFMLNNDRSDFDNPLLLNHNLDYERIPVLFLTNSLLTEMLKETRCEFVQFLFRKREYQLLVDFVGEYMNSDYVDKQELFALANSCMRIELYPYANQVFGMLNKNRDGGEKVMKGLADSMFMLNEYESAADAYKELMEMDGKNISYVIYHGLSLINSGKVQEGLDHLFRIDYQHPDNHNIKHALAWGYLMNRKPAEAERIYDRLIGEESNVDSDLLNAGYAKWMQGKNEEAMRLMVNYSNASKYNKVASDFNKDSKLLDLYNIGKYERAIMISMVKQSKQNGRAS